MKNAPFNKVTAPGAAAQGDMTQTKKAASGTAKPAAPGSTTSGAQSEGKAATGDMTKARSLASKK